jgi:hypothetical protein
MRPASEYTEVLGGPLPIKRLAQIWASLPERERLDFCHSLDETTADQLLAATAIKEATPIGARHNQQKET